MSYGAYRESYRTKEGEVIEWELISDDTVYYIEKTVTEEYNIYDELDSLLHTAKTLQAAKCYLRAYRRKLKSENK